MSLSKNNENMHKYFYLVMMVAGIVLPYSQFVPWFMSDGSIMNIVPFAFSNRVSAGITLDALIAAVFLVGFILLEKRSVRVKHIWIPVVGIFLFGIAFAYPCYFYLRSMSMDQRKV